MENTVEIINLEDFTPYKLTDDDILLITGIVPVPTVTP